MSNHRNELKDEYHYPNSIVYELNDEVKKLKDENEYLNGDGFRNLKSTNENIKKENNTLFEMLEKRDKLFERILNVEEITADCGSFYIFMKQIMQEIRELK